MKKSHALVREEMKGGNEVSAASGITHSPKAKFLCPAKNQRRNQKPFRIADVSPQIEKIFLRRLIQPRSSCSDWYSCETDYFLSQQVARAGLHPEVVFRYVILVCTLLSDLFAFGELRQRTAASEQRSSFRRTLSRLPLNFAPNFERTLYG